MSLNTDPIADMLSRIRNASMRRKPFVDVPYSSMKVRVIKILQQEGYILRYAIVDGNPAPVIKVLLKYKEGKSVITEIKRVSKPGRRAYADKKSIPSIIGGLGITIISTSKGVITGKKAKELGIGGEMICTVR